jgi:hypothetical protein
MSNEIEELIKLDNLDKIDEFYSKLADNVDIKNIDYFTKLSLYLTEKKNKLYKSINLDYNSKNKNNILILDVMITKTLCLDDLK